MTPPPNVPFRDNCHFLSWRGTPLQTSGEGPTLNNGKQLRAGDERYGLATADVAQGYLLPLNPPTHLRVLRIPPRRAQGSSSSARTRQGGPEDHQDRQAVLRNLPAPQIEAHTTFRKNRQGPHFTTKRGSRTEFLPVRMSERRDFGDSPLASSKLHAAHFPVRKEVNNTA